MRSRSQSCTQGRPRDTSRRAPRRAGTPDQAAARSPRGPRPSRVVKTSSACAGTCTPLARASTSRPVASIASSGSIGSPRKLARAEQTTRVRIARELVRAIRERTRRASGLERELATLVADQAPQLLALPGCGTLSAAKIIAETAGVERFRSDAKLARLAGVAPIPASSGNRQRHRLDRGGNRQLNCALHRIAVTQGRVHPTRSGLPRPQAGRGQVADRGASLPQAPPRQSRLAGSSVRAHESRSLPLPYYQLPISSARLP